MQVIQVSGEGSRSGLYVDGEDGKAYYDLGPGDVLYLGDVIELTEEPVLDADEVEAFLRVHGERGSIEAITVKMRRWVSEPERADGV